MEQYNLALAMLDLMPCPALLVKDGTIIHANPAAGDLRQLVGSRFEDVLITGRQEYRDYDSGQLNLTFQFNGQTINAAVTCTEGYQLILPELDSENPELRALALASQNLRSPLSDAMIVTEHFLPRGEENTASNPHYAKINRSLYQLQRVVSNMSDAYLYSQKPFSQMEVRCITDVMAELFERCGALIAHTGITLTYTGIDEPVYGLIDAEKLERAVENLLSNAVKFAPKNGLVDARLTRKGNMLYLTISDNGSGIRPDIRQTLFSRHLRQPGLDDSRNGLGLGLTIARSIATLHGGTLLMQPAKEQGTRFTMTIAIRSSEKDNFRSPILRIDYAGERDHALMEFSEFLPSSLYER